MTSRDAVLQNQPCSKLSRSNEVLHCRQQENKRYDVLTELDTINEDERQKPCVSCCIGNSAKPNNCARLHESRTTQHCLSNAEIAGHGYAF